MEREGINIQPLLNQEQLNNKCGLFARVTILPGHTLADHEHHGEAEAYHILSGSGTYVDDGKRLPAKPGDTFYCADGHSHGISCGSEEPLEFIALIIKA